MRVTGLLLTALALSSCVTLSDDDRRAYACNRDAGGEQCTGGWVCSITGRCVDPAKGENTLCIETADCMGGFVCNLEKTCVDPSIGTASKCVVDGDCMGGYRCGVDGVCAAPADDGVPADAPTRYARPMNVALLSPLTGAFVPTDAQQLSLSSPREFENTTQVAAFSFDGGNMVGRVWWPSSFSPTRTTFIQREAIPAPPGGVKRLVATHAGTYALTDGGALWVWPESVDAGPTWQPVELDGGVVIATGLWGVNTSASRLLAQTPGGYLTATRQSLANMGAASSKWPDPLVDAVGLAAADCAVLAYQDKMSLSVWQGGRPNIVALEPYESDSAECNIAIAEPWRWPKQDIVAVYPADDGALGVLSRDGGVDTVHFVTFTYTKNTVPLTILEFCKANQLASQASLEACYWHLEFSKDCQPCGTGALIDLQVESQTKPNNWTGWARCEIGGAQEVRRIIASSGSCIAERIPTQSVFTRATLTPELTNHARLGGIDSDGRLWSGSSPLDAMALTLTQPPTGVTTLMGAPMLVGRELGRYQPDTGFVAMRSGSEVAIGNSVNNYPMWLQVNGALVDTTAIEGDYMRVVAERDDRVPLDGLFTITPMSGGQRWLLYASEDQLYAAEVTETLDGGPRAELSFQLTPSPGNPVLAMVPVAPTGDSVASVYVLTTSGLSLVTAPAGRRWRAQQLEIGDGVAVGLFAEAGNARVVFDDGRILSLPSRLMMAQPREDGVLHDANTLCGQPVALFSDGLYRLAAPSADAGFGTWELVSQLNGTDGALLTPTQPLLSPDAGSALWLFEANGRASEITVQGCD